MAPGEVADKANRRDNEQAAAKRTAIHARQPIKQHGWATTTKSTD
jgi:hypothetical protein